jgi:hypothetical protein
MTESGSPHFGAWIRYGDPITPEQVAFAIENYRVAILQPWEVAAAREMKLSRPDMVVLCYKCLSSTRSYEPGPIYSSGLSYVESEELGEKIFAHRLNGDRIEWNGYSGHWQMAVWDAEYRDRWCRNVVAELRDSVWDGVMADNDIFDDYYGLCPPFVEVENLAAIRAALDELIETAGHALNSVGKLLVPNIAESRRQPGRWDRHSAYGGGFEEVWLAYGPDDYLDVATVLAQGSETRGPGLTIMRVASDGTDTHQNFTYGLAAFWIFGGGNGTAVTATGHDQYSGTPFIPQLNWDLGEPVQDIHTRGNGRSRRFTNGWAGVNLNMRRNARVTFRVPPGLVDAMGRPAPSSITLMPHEGVLYMGA